jgi:hypothetical protein
MLSVASLRIVHTLSCVHGKVTHRTKPHVDLTFLEQHIHVNPLLLWPVESCGCEIAEAESVERKV